MKHKIFFSPQPFIEIVCFLLLLIIILWQDQDQISELRIEENFSKLGYKRGKYINIASWKLITFQKDLYDIPNWIEHPDSFVSGIGTFGYKGKVYNEALSLIYEDFKKGEIGQSSFWGSFLIVIMTNNDVSIIRDGAGLTRLYALRSKNIYSNFDRLR